MTVIWDTQRRLSNALILALAVFLTGLVPPFCSAQKNEADSQAGSAIRPEIAPVRPISIDQALQERRFNQYEPFAISPDDQFVAFAPCGLPDSFNEASIGSKNVAGRGLYFYAAGCHVEVEDLRTSKREQINSAGSIAFLPAWSPDGHWLAYYSDQGGQARIWIWNRQTRKSEAVENEIALPLFDGRILWQPDSRAFYARALPEDSASADQSDKRKDADNDSQQIVQILPSPSSSSASPNILEQWDYADIVRVETQSRAFTRLVRHAPVREYWLAPDAKHLVFMGPSYTSERSSTYWLSRIVLVDTESGKQTVLADPVEPFGKLMWSPDSTMVAHVGSGFTASGEENPGDLTIYGVATGTQSFTSKGQPHPKFGLDERWGYSHDSPLWTPDSARLILGTPHEVWAWERSTRALRRIAALPNTKLVAHVGSLSRSIAWVSAEGHSIALLAMDPGTGDTQLYTVDIASGEINKTYQQPSYWGGSDMIARGIDLGREGQTIYAVIEQSNRRPALYGLDKTLSMASKIVSLDEIDSDFILGRSQLVEWGGLHGETIRGALLLPAGYQPGNRYPLIVYQYPLFTGSMSLNSYGFENGEFGDFQFFATRGYAVLVPDLPLTSMKISEIGAQLERAVDRVVNLGIADPKRVGIAGESMGGHTCIAAIEGTNRFAAAVCQNAVWVALTAENFTMDDDGGYMTGVGYGLYNLGGSFWKNKQTFFDNDLVFNADRIRTPLLIVRGDLDPIPMNGDALYVALRDLNREVSYVRYANVAHDLLRVPPATRRDYLTRIETWLDLHLKQEASSASQEVSHPEP
jgi:dipeptidyl aminopeptidase/acylaminoacyl peptidase